MFFPLKVKNYWYNTLKICSKIRSIMGRKKIDSDLVFDAKYLKTKIKSYDDKITTNFYGKAPKKRYECVCFSAIVINSVFKLCKSYFRQTFLEECKHKIKKKVIKSFVENDRESSSSNDNSEEE